MREKEVEQKLVKAVKARGGICPKWVSPGFDGMPDRIVFLPGRHIGFVEVKAPGEKPRALQKVKRNPKSKSAIDEALQIEKFFRSPWYQQLTSVDGEFLFRKLQDEIRQSE